MAKILVVDDEKVISDVISYNLQKEGFDVVVADDGQAAMDLFESENPDLILLDQMLPELDGSEVLRRIRATSNVPIIFVTAKDDEIDKVLGLELGADDYVTKPFSNRELISRVKARLRNANPSSQVNQTNSGFQIMNVSDISINTETFTVKKGDEILDITHREFELIVFLLRQQGKVFTRDHLLNEVWGFDYYGDERTVDVTVRRIREKIENDPSKPKILLTKRGVGYYIQQESTNE